MGRFFFFFFFFCRSWLNCFLPHEAALAQSAPHTHTHMNTTHTRTQATKLSVTYSMLHARSGLRRACVHALQIPLTHILVERCCSDTRGENAPYFLCDVLDLWARSGHKGERNVLMGVKIDVHRMLQTSDSPDFNTAEQQRQIWTQCVLITSEYLSHFCVHYCSFSDLSNLY